MISNIAQLLAKTETALVAADNPDVAKRRIVIKEFMTEIE
jgi:hypothetical protein